MLEVYQNQGFELNEPDYVIQGLGFIGTCGSFPEQYDIIWTDNGVKYQVGYVRLRGGYFAVYFPDVDIETKPLHSTTFIGCNKGSFDCEESRLIYLDIAARFIKQALDDLSQGGS